MDILENKIELVFAFLRSLPEGKAVSYAAVAREAGLSNPRSVGWILERNCLPDEIPCYKVVRSDGRLADGYKFGGPAAQRLRLASAGIEMKNGRVSPDCLIR
jgi:methylated-DNA-protein-cysteine methyltransferase related protein